MVNLTGPEKYLHLRHEFPWFKYESVEIIRERDVCFIFNFNVSDRYRFSPSITLPYHPLLNTREFSDEALYNLGFHIGLVELISYWKAFCSPEVRIAAGKLIDISDYEWWRKLYFHGLGEFFFLNGIEPDYDEFMHITQEGDRKIEPFRVNTRENFVMVPVGGGKDSVVTLELMKMSGKRVVPFIVNPRGASSKSVEAAGLQKDLLVVKRRLDPLLLELNSQGYLNGHTPFSALLAFVSVLTASMAGISSIALSNESSANESTVPGSKINHQYSKSFEFENDFRWYLKKNVTVDINYYSFLRPLSEIQIAALFSRFKWHHESFRSCNVGSKTDSWCGACAKCLFTSIMLAPFLGVNRIHELLGKDILDDLNLLPLLDELSGFSSVKPFECVGTITEVKAALNEIAKIERRIPLLVERYLEKDEQSHIDLFGKHLRQFDGEHNVPAELFQQLKETLNDHTGY